MDIGKIIGYWLKSSEEDYITAQTLFSNKRYAHSLFFCHLVLEKIIKALVVKKTKTHAPTDHDLRRLLAIADIRLSEEQLADLEKINSFNIRGRYDDYKFEFYKKANSAYAEKYFSKAKNLYLWLKKELEK